MSNTKKTAIVEPERLLEKTEQIAREIESKAFDLFRARNGEVGSETDDWFSAEKEILRWVPVEVRETDDKVIVTAAVPGFRPEQIQVGVCDKQLILSGETESSEARKEGNLILQEWKGDRFFRQLTLPASIEEDGVKVALNNGMLELMLPKATEKVVVKAAVNAA